MILSRKDIAEFPLNEVLRAVARDDVDAMPSKAREIHAELFSRSENLYKPLGIAIPSEVFFRRDFTTANQGGMFVQSSVSPNVVPPLLPDSICARLGATVLRNLKSNCKIPRQTSSFMPSVVGEIVTLPTTDITLDQIVLTPKRIGVKLPFSRELEIMGSVSISNFLAEAMTRVLTVRIDKYALLGGDGITGILGTTGIGNVTFGGAATFAKMLEFVQSLATQNALGDRPGWVISGSTMAKLMGTSKGGGYPKFIYENGQIAGYPAIASNLIEGDLALFGDFSQLLIGSFGPFIDVTLDRFSLAENGIVKLVANAYFDSAVLHPESFCLSTDAANQ